MLCVSQSWLFSNYLMQVKRKTFFFFFEMIKMVNLQTKSTHGNSNSIRYSFSNQLWIGFSCSEHTDACVCIYIHIYVVKYMYTYICIYVYMYVHTHTHRAKTLGWMMGYVHNTEDGSFGYGAAVFALFYTQATTLCAVWDWRSVVTCGCEMEIQP